MCSEIERALKRIIVTIQMWINFISPSSRFAAVIAEAIEVDNKPFIFILPFEVKVFQCYTCMYKINKNFIAHLVDYSR